MAERPRDQDRDESYDEEPDEDLEAETSDLDYLPPRNPRGQRYRRWIPITVALVGLAVFALMISLIFREAEESAKAPAKLPPKAEPVSTNGRPQALDQLRDAAQRADGGTPTEPTESAQVRELRRQIQEMNARLAQQERDKEAHATTATDTKPSETKSARATAPDAQAVRAAAERQKAAHEAARAKKKADTDAKKDRVMWQRESKKDGEVGAVKTVSDYSLTPGWGIPCTTKYAISSRASGPVVLHVTQNVYDSATGQHLLMPQGATLNGESSGRIVFGDDTQQLTITQMTVGKQIYTLGKLPVQDPTGQTGLKDQVETFWGRALMSVVIRSGLQAGASAATVGGENVGERAAGMTAQNAAAEGGRQVQQLINITPRLTYRAGGRCWLTVKEPISFAQPYTADPVAQQRLAYQAQQGW